MASEYSADNIFAKILDKKEPCFKVYESRTCLAFLDAFPWVEGHTIVVPKLKGYTDLLSMPPAKAADFLGEVQRVARAVKEATGATGVNILQNNGPDASQTVLHPHFHVIPRKAGDDLLKFPTGAKTTIDKDVAGPVQAKIEEALNPKKPLKKARFGKVSNIRPDSTGLNLKLKVVGDPQDISSKIGMFTEVLCGDPSGTVVVSLHDNEKHVAKKDAVIALRNATAKVVSGQVHLVVNKWGKAEVCDEAMDGDVEMDPKKNVSATDYEAKVEDTPLKKAKFGKVSSIRPDSTGLNLKLKVVGEPQEISSKAGSFMEVLCGDHSGTVVVSFRDNEKDVAKKDAIVALRNATAKMVSGHIRLVINKWGKVEACDEAMDDAVEMDSKKNKSATEYELVPN